MAQHAAALSNNNQLHPAMAQIPMLSAAGLNLTVSGPNINGNDGKIEQTLEEPVDLLNFLHGAFGEITIVEWI